MTLGGWLRQQRLTINVIGEPPLQGALPRFEVMFGVGVGIPGT